MHISSITNMHHSLWPDIIFSLENALRYLQILLAILTQVLVSYLLKSGFKAVQVEE